MGLHLLIQSIKISRYLIDDSRVPHTQLVEKNNANEAPNAEIAELATRH
jgi:hypothetical protein